MPGLDLRDLFAAAALTGLVSAFADPGDAAAIGGPAPAIAEDAYRLADAMLRERGTGEATRRASELEQAIRALLSSDVVRSALEGLAPTPTKRLLDALETGAKCPACGAPAVRDTAGDIRCAACRDAYPNPTPHP